MPIYNETIGVVVCCDYEGCKKELAVPWDALRAEMTRMRADGWLIDCYGCDIGEDVRCPEHNKEAKGRKT